MFWSDHRKTNDWINEVIGIAAEDFVSDTWKLAAEPFQTCTLMYCVMPQKTKSLCTHLAL